MRTRAPLVVVLAALAILPAAVPIAAADTYRLHDAITAFIPNPEGRELTVSLDVRDINIFESGPRQVLVKIYGPDGKALVRQVIPDDGITGGAYQHPIAAFDHEAWYYAYCRLQGAAPMIRWSTYSDPARLAALAKRTFDFRIPAGPPGVYRVLVAGAIDHYITVRISPELPYGVAGHPTFLHGHGQQFSRSFIHVPRGSRGLYFVTGAWDVPRRRHFKLTAPDGTVLHEVDTSSPFTTKAIEYETPGQYDDQILALEITGGEGSDDFLLEIQHRLGKDPQVNHRGERAVPAVLAPDAATAKAIQGGAIYHDGQVFWQPFQIRLHEWLKRLEEKDFVPTDADGNPVALEDLPKRPGFIPLNGPHFRPPLCDRLMHDWPAHRQRAALNVAIRDLAAGLRSIGPNDHVAVAVGGPFANMGYEFSNYAFHYWRPGWRVLQQSDAPDEVKEILREAFLVCGDRLAFCRGWARVNGNSFALIPAALRYCSEATADPLQKELFETYFDRFSTGGWGERTGIGPSGPVQEGFAYAYHYASYPLQSWRAVLADFQDPRFQNAYDRLRNWFSYTLADERISAGAWSARTHFYPQWSIESDGPFAWKGLPGPDFTESVNDANEWFAARRKTYYVLTYHGRLSPVWNGNASAGQCGYGGGMICQLHVPGHGTVLASTLNGEYGKGMHLSQWPNFHIHSLVGTAADGRPLVCADSEHFDARLDGATLTSSGDVRTASVHVRRSYTFSDQGIDCRVELRPGDQVPLLNLWVKSDLHGKVAGAWEMIPFVANTKPQPGQKPQPTAVTALDEQGKVLGPLAVEPVSAKAVVIDRGGFGVRIELDQPRPVGLGKNHTVLIGVVGSATPAEAVSLGYRLLPFVAPAKE